MRPLYKKLMTLFMLALTVLTVNISAGGQARITYQLPLNFQLDEIVDHAGAGMAGQVTRYHVEKSLKEKKRLVEFMPHALVHAGARHDYLMGSMPPTHWLTRLTRGPPVQFA